MSTLTVDQVGASPFCPANQHPFCSTRLPCPHTRSSRGQKTAYQRSIGGLLKPFRNLSSRICPQDLPWAIWVATYLMPRQTVSTLFVCLASSCFGWSQPLYATHLFVIFYSRDASLCARAAGRENQHGGSPRTPPTKMPPFLGAGRAHETPSGQMGLRRWFWLRKGPSSRSRFRRRFCRRHFRGGRNRCSGQEIGSGKTIHKHRRIGEIQRRPESIIALCGRGQQLQSAPALGRRRLWPLPARRQQRLQSRSCLRELSRSHPGEERTR